MNRFTINDIRSWEPCYDPTRYLPEGWRGTALDILAVENCPAIDRLWVVIRNECIDERTLRLFAAWCARQALALIDNPDPRSVAAVDMAERFAVGEATVDELEAAGAAAWDASAAAWAAARDAAGAAAGAAARDANAAVRAAASGTAWAAARDAARDAQVVYLRQMLGGAYPNPLEF